MSVLMFYAGSGNWVDSGCVTERISMEYVKCSCNHLSLFGVLVVRIDNSIYIVRGHIIKLLVAQNVC